MCYTDELNNKGLKFFISNCFGIGFDWKDQDFIEAVRNRDERLWGILEWAAQGGAEEFDTAASFEESLSSYRRDSASELLRFMRYADEAPGKIEAALESRYLSAQARQCIDDYRSGKLAERASEEEPKAKNRAAKPGYVYLILAENGMYKIGKAKNVKTRLKPFSVEFPMKWDLLHSFQSEDYSAAEAELHEMYADKRGVGEWFKLEPADVEYITSIQDGQL